MNTDTISPNLGFEILKEAQDTRHRLVRGGLDALVSLAKALIWSRTSDPAEVAEEMCGIAGRHLTDEIDRVLMEGENIHWWKDEDGSLILVHE